MASNFQFSTNADLQLNQLLNAVVQNLSTAPSSPTAGLIYFDTTLNLLRFYDGANWQSGTVTSVSAADGTITVGGTGGSVTLKVAKTLDHTYITDFLVTVKGVTLDQMGQPVATVSFNSQLLTGIANAVNATDAMNLQSVQALLASLSDRADVVYATSAALPANTYANGTAGSGATLTGNSNGALTIDSAASIVQTGQRILVQNEATTANNGIYTVTSPGSGSTPYVLTRAADFNTASNISTGVLIPCKAPTGISAGSTNNNKIFASICPSPVTIGTSAISFTLVGSAYSADGVTIQLNGTVFSLVSPVTVANGGTGATTPAGARSNLSAAGLYKTTLGDGTTTVFTVNHSLNNLYPAVACYYVSTKVRFEPGVQAVDANNLQITINPAPSSSNVAVSVIG